MRSPMRAPGGTRPCGIRSVLFSCSGPNCEFGSDAPIITHLFNVTVLRPTFESPTLFLVKYQDGVPIQYRKGALKSIRGEWDARPPCSDLFTS